MKTKAQDFIELEEKAEEVKIYQNFEPLCNYCKQPLRKQGNFIAEHTDYCCDLIYKCCGKLQKYTN
jgi:hypothetical protein